MYLRSTQFITEEWKPRLLWSNVVSTLWSLTKLKLPTITNSVKLSILNYNELDQVINWIIYITYMYIYTWWMLSLYRVLDNRWGRALNNNNTGPALNDWWLEVRRNPARSRAPPQRFRDELWKKRNWNIILIHTVWAEKIATSYLIRTGRIFSAFQSSSPLDSRQKCFFHVKWEFEYMFFEMWRNKLTPFKKTEVIWSAFSDNVLTNSEKHPIMPCPVYLHWDGSYYTYQHFFSHIQCKLEYNLSETSLATDQLILGSD